MRVKKRVSYEERARFGRGDSPVEDEGGTVESEPGEDELADGGTLEDEPVEGGTVEDEPVEGGTVEDEPVEGGTVEDEPVEDEPVAGGAI